MYVCTVVGFFNATYSGVEQGPGHSVPVGYIKGAEAANQNLVFNVISTPGTASEFIQYDLFHTVDELISIQCHVGEGSQFDYTVNTARVRALSSGAIGNVVLTFRVDAVAQEPKETFTLTLDPLVFVSPHRRGFFFRNTIEVTIIDSDSKNKNLT